MPESRDRLDLNRLAHLAYKGQLYQASDTVTAGAATACNFALWNNGSKGLPLRLVSVRVSSTVAQSVTFGTLVADPALTAGNQAVNAYLGGNGPEANNEAQALAAIAVINTLGIIAVPVTGTYELLSPGSLFIPPNNGVAVVSPVGVATMNIVWLWAELPPEDEAD
jgi:hypothetical protein